MKKLFTLFILTGWLNANSQCKLIDKWDKFDSTFSRQSEKVTIIGTFLNPSTGQIEKNSEGSLQLLFYKKDTSNYLCCFFQKANGGVAVSDKDSKLSLLTDKGKLVLSASGISISKPEGFNTSELVTLFPVDRNQILDLKESKTTDCRFDYADGRIEDSIKEKTAIRLSKAAECFLNTPITNK